LQRLVSPEELDLVALSHLHPDHAADMTGLHVYANFWPGAAIDALPVWGPAGTTEQLDAQQYSSGGGHSKYNVQTWKAGLPVQVGPMNIIPYPMVHPVEAWGLRITGPSSVGPGQCTLAYTGDTDLCPGLEDLVADADLLLIEASFLEGRDLARGVHLTGWRAGQVADRGGVKQVVVTHMPPWYKPVDIINEVAAAFAGPVHQAEANQVFVI